MGTIAKAIYTAIMAALLAAQAIYFNIAWLTIVQAGLTAVGVYIIPNATTKREPVIVIPGDDS